MVKKIDKAILTKRYNKKGERVCFICEKKLHKSLLEAGYDICLKCENDLNKNNNSKKNKDDIKLSSFVFKSPNFY